MTKANAILLALAFGLLLAPTATADPDDPYYVRADAHPAEGPREYDMKRDCTVSPTSTSPTTTTGSIGYTTSQVKPDETRPNGSVAHLVPNCYVLAIGVEVCDSPCVIDPPRFTFAARTTYDLGSGNYTIALTPGTATSGNSGLSILFDCRDCPPPGR